MKTQQDCKQEFEHLCQSIVDQIRYIDDNTPSETTELTAPPTWWVDMQQIRHIARTYLPAIETVRPIGVTENVLKYIDTIYNKSKLMSISIIRMMVAREMSLTEQEAIDAVEYWLQTYKQQRPEQKEGLK